MKNATKEFQVVFDVKGSSRSKVRALKRVKWKKSISILDNHWLYTNFYWTSFSFDLKNMLKVSLLLAASPSFAHTWHEHFHARRSGRDALPALAPWHNTQCVLLLGERAGGDAERKAWPRCLLASLSGDCRCRGKLCVCDQLLSRHWVLIVVHQSTASMTTKRSIGLHANSICS